MPNQKIVTEAALSALASDIKTALSEKANSNDVYLKSQTYNKTEIDNALNLKADKSELYNVYPTDQESGSIAHITDGADNIPVKSLKCVIGSDGFSQADITVCGKNLLVNRRTTTTLNGVTFTVNNDGSITLSGTASTSFQYNLNNSPLKSAKYTMSNGNTNLISGIALFAVTPSGNKDVNRITGFVTFEDSVSIVALWITSGTNTNGVTIKPMIELGDTVTTFEAYNGTTYTVEFGQTFNDGMLVYENGEWFVDGAGVITPIVSSTIIKTISGDNNIYSNTGDVEVNYHADIGLYIDKKISSLS